MKRHIETVHKARHVPTAVSEATHEPVPDEQTAQSTGGDSGEGTPWWIISELFGSNDIAVQSHFPAL